jgi:CRISPR-associated endonuclease Csn1
MPKAKRYRFAEDGYQRWLKKDKDFLARALNDTRYLSRIAFEYVSAICPSGTRVIPGQMTAMLRAKFGLNDILGLHGEKNRNDHRHHAVDACVIAVTDQAMLQRFAAASAHARSLGLDRLIENMPLPWESYREHVERAVRKIFVSHRPDHGYEGAMHNDTAYGLLEEGRVSVRKIIDERRVKVIENLKVIPFSNSKSIDRHGMLADGSPRPYKGYKGDSNYCIEISIGENKRWEGDVISTFDAYQVVRNKGLSQLRNPKVARNGKTLVMRVVVNDILRLVVDGLTRTMRVVTISGNGQIFMADHHEANTDARNRNRNDQFGYVSKMAGSLKAARARSIQISPIGEVNDPGFRG